MSLVKHNKWVSGLLGLGLVMFCLPMAKANAVEQLDDLTVLIRVAPDSSLLVSEALLFDFGDAKYNNWQRVIPLVYQSGGKGYQIDALNFIVSDDKGVIYNPIIKNNVGSVIVTVNSQDKPFSGRRSFMLSYKVFNAVRNNDAQAELLWNVNGYNWAMGIENLSVKVELPKKIEASQLAAVCEYGIVKDKLKCLTDLAPADGISVAANSPEKLYPGEALNIDITFPLGVVEIPTVLQIVKGFGRDNWPFAAPVVSFLSGLLWWIRAGRDPRKREALGSRFDPPNDISLLEAGYLLKNYFDRRDLAAELLLLAQQGFYSIELVSVDGGIDYQLVKRRPLTPMVNDYERLVLASLFSNRDVVRLSTYLSELPSQLPDIQESVKSSLRIKEIYSKASSLRKTLIILLWLLFGAVSWYLGGYYGYKNLDTILMGSAGGVLALFASLKPTWSKRWLEVIQHLKAFERYLSINESDSSSFNSGVPMRNPQLFEKYLPHAMVFGVEKFWTAQYNSFILSAPTWFSNPYWTKSFDQRILTDDLITFALVVEGQVVFPANNS